MIHIDSSFLLFRPCRRRSPEVLWGCRNLREPKTLIGRLQRFAKPFTSISCTESIHRHVLPFLPKCLVPKPIKALFPCPFPHHCHSHRISCNWQLVQCPWLSAHRKCHLPTFCPTTAPPAFRKSDSLAHQSLFQKLPAPKPQASDVTLLPLEKHL